MSYIYNLATGKVRENASLLWLVRNGHKVGSMTLWELEGGRGKFIATLCESGVPVCEFHSNFASWKVMLDWCNRPSLAGAVKYKHHRAIVD